MITQIVGAYVLFVAAVASTAWWLASLGKVLKLYPSFAMSSAAAANRSVRFKPQIPRFRLRLRERMERWMMSRIESYLKSIKVSKVSVLFVYVIQPLVVIGGLTNRVGIQWIGDLMLVVVVLNWIVLGLQLVNRTKCANTVEVSSKAKWCTWVELVLYAVPVLYTWYQFTESLG